MKRIALIIVVAVAALAGIGISVTYGAFSLEAAGKNNRDLADEDMTVVSRNISIRDFSEVDVAGNMTVIYSPAAKASMTVTGPKYCLDNMEVEIKGKSLKIGYSQEFYKRTGNQGFSWKQLFGGDSKKGKVRVTLSSSSPLRKVASSLSADFKAENLKNTADMELYSSTSGDIKLGTISASSLKATASTSGDVKIGSVRVSDATLNAETSGDVKIGTLSTDNLNAVASTSGDVKIEDLSAHTVNASASTSGDVVLAGSAINVTFSASTSGDIKASGLTAETATVSASTSGDVYYNARKTINKQKGGIHNSYDE